MALIIETQLTCDGCGESFGEDNKNRTGMQQRAVAFTNGWVYSSTKDFCPNCRYVTKSGTYQKSHPKKVFAVQESR